MPLAGLIEPGLSRQPLGADFARQRRWRTCTGRHARRARDAGCAPAPQPERGTSHFVAVDRWGDVASETSTIESSFGSGLMVNGYYLNNELTDFSFVPEKDGCPVANRVEGGKRPRSSMSPTIVYGPDGQVRARRRRGGRVDDPGAGDQDHHRRARLPICRAQEAIALPMIYAPGDTVFVESGTFLEA